MKKRTAWTLTLALVALLIFTAARTPGLRHSQAGHNLPRSHPDDRTIRGRARKALAEGKRELRIPLPIGLYAEVSGIEDALPFYDVIVARPVTKTSLLLDPYFIASFYKLEIGELISPMKETSHHHSLKLPPGLLPPNETEFYLQAGGGALTIDGVRVIQVEEFGQLVPGQNYLLFVQRHPSGVGMVDLGPEGVFKIRPDGSLESLSTKPTPLARDIKAKYGNSLSRLKASIK